jgi:hypothetical protein
MYGGAASVLSPAAVNDTSMSGPSKMNLAQGDQYLQFHEGQHGGGGYQNNFGAPVTASTTTDVNHTIARDAVQVEALRSIQGMSDQSGGGRRRKGRRVTRHTRSNAKSHAKILKMLRQLSKKMKRRARSQRGGQGCGAMPKQAGGAGCGTMPKQAGGAGYQVGPPGDYGSSSMLLNPSQEAIALRGMNTVEWKLAESPSSFAPNMSR